MPVIRPYENQTQLNGVRSGTATAEDFGGGAGKALIAAGSDVEQAADTINQVDETKARLRAASLVTQSDNNWRQQMIARQQDPDFASKYGADGSGFSTAFKTDFETYAQQQIGAADPKDRKYVEQGMYNLGEGLMGDAMQFEAHVGAQFATQTIQSSIDTGRNNAMINPAQYTSIMQNTQLVISQAPHLNAAERLKLSTDATQNVTTGAVMGMLKNGGAGAASQILSGNMSMTTIDDKGQPVQKPLAELMDGATFETVQNAAQSVIKQQAAAIKQVSTDLHDDFSTKIKLNEDPSGFVDLASQIEKNKDTLGKKNYDDLRVELHEKTKKLDEDVDSAQRGNAFATGTAYLNPADPKSMKDYNAYYKQVVQPTLADMTPDQRNTRITSLVAQTKVIPDDLKGDIKITARSMNADQVSQAADLVDRIRQKNPNLIQDFDQKDLARIDLVNQKIASGIVPSEAFKQTDEILDPNNSALIEARTKYLAKKSTGMMATNYQGMAMSNFTHNFAVRMLPGNSMSVEDTDSTFAKNTVGQLTADYKNAYDNQFKLTGDTTSAEKYANTVVSGTYGVSTINGRNQLMRFAPEKYFAIDGQNNDWMQKQLADAVKENAGPDKILQSADTDMSKRIILTPDPAVTSRTAKDGRPLYKLFYQNDNGGLDDVLGSGKYFTFDPDKRRQEILDETRSLEERKAQVKKEGTGETQYQMIGAGL